MKNAEIEIGEEENEVSIVYFDSQKDEYAALQNSTLDTAYVYSLYAFFAEGQVYKTEFSDCLNCFLLVYIWKYGKWMLTGTQAKTPRVPVSMYEKDN